MASCGHLIDACAQDSACALGVEGLRNVDAPRRPRPLTDGACVIERFLVVDIFLFKLYGDFLLLASQSYSMARTFHGR